MKTKPFDLPGDRCEALFNEAEATLRAAIAVRMAQGGEQMAFAFNLGTLYAAMRLLRTTHSVDALLDVVAKLSAQACLDHETQEASHA